MTTLREAAQQALDFIRWSQFVPCQSEPFPEPPSTAPQVEAALKAALAEPVPVAWMNTEDGFCTLDSPVEGIDVMSQWVPLYLTPAQRKPLSEEEITQCFADAGAIVKGHLWVKVIRNVERAHGITS